MFVKLVAVRQLYKPAKVKNGDTAADMADDGEVMGNEQVGDALILLKLLQHIDDLSLN